MDGIGGLAAAIRTGIRTTDAAVCGSIDADLSYDPMEIAAMLPLLADAESPRAKDLVDELKALQAIARD